MDELEKVEDIDYVEIGRIPTFSALATIKAIFGGEGIKYFIWGEQMIGAGVMSGGGAAIKLHGDVVYLFTNYLI